MALKSVYLAQTIVSDLDDKNDRNFDYLISVNTLTGYILVTLGKYKEALEFVKIAEKVAFQLVDLKARESQMSKDYP